MTKSLWLAIIVSVVIIGGMTWVLVTTPAPTDNGNGNGNENGNDIPTPPFTSEHVTVFSPLPGATVGKMFTVMGEARGNWYFEADFPIEVLDADGASLGMWIATAQAEWMTMDFVPFFAPVAISGYTGPATLILHKDNPSGLPEHDDSVSFAIVVQ